MDEEMRELLDFATRVQTVRAVYHRAIGESIQLRLAFRDAPEIEVVEDLDAGTVTMRLGDDTLTLRPGRPYAEDQATMRAWIRGWVDVTLLEPGPHQGAGVRYWRGVARE